MTERGEFRFTVKDGEGDTQSIVFEPAGQELRSIKGALGFDLREGTDARAVADFLMLIFGRSLSRPAIHLCTLKAPAAERSSNRTASAAEPAQAREQTASSRP